MVGIVLDLWLEEFTVKITLDLVINLIKNYSTAYGLSSSVLTMDVKDVITTNCIYSKQEC